MRASAIQVALANMNARTTEIKHQCSPKNHVPPKYKVAYDGKQKIQYIKSHTARFSMKMVLLFQSLSNANLHKIGEWKLFYNLVTMTVPIFIKSSGGINGSNLPFSIGSKRNCQKRQSIPNYSCY